jgi:hypothetical protein
MRIAFTAIDASFSDDGEVLYAVLSTGDNWGEEDGHYINFQRAHEDSPESQNVPSWEENGLYFEFDDQNFGGYGHLRSCRLSRDVLSVDFSKPLNDLPDVEGIDVRLAIGPKSYDSLRAGLSRIFHGLTDRLILQ